MSKPPNLVAPDRAIASLRKAAPGRVAFYGLESPEGLPIYVHAKVCIIDDPWDLGRLRQLQPQVLDSRL